MTPDAQSIAQQFLNWCYTHNRGNCVSSATLRQWMPSLFQQSYLLTEVYQILDDRLELVRDRQGKSHHQGWSRKVWMYPRVRGRSDYPW